MSHRSHRIIGAEIQKVLHRRKILSGRGGEKIRRVGQADAAAVYQTKIILREMNPALAPLDSTDPDDGLAAGLSAWRGPWPDTA